MAKRVAVTQLNASTIDILNTIRANASYEYQSLVPTITYANEIPKVGEVLFGYPALANQFINALVNRIALVRIKSATFNNDYAELKKGYLEFGETVEEVFVEIAKAREFSAEKAPQREFKRTMPDVKSAFHVMNWRVQYPVTIQDEDLRMAFTDINGVQDLIAKIVDSVYRAQEYDEYLLFKYLMIKAIAHGKMYPVSFDATDIKNGGKALRRYSNELGFLKTQYNEAGVHTNTAKEDQYIFMDSAFNADYDVEVLAGAFNMDKAEYIGKLKLIDDWTTFDNDRFSDIRANSDMIEEVTAEELALMQNVKAVLVDKEWFQIYDNANRMTENYVSSGLYWNYFYNVWKTLSTSPFSNAIVFVDDSATLTVDDTFTVEVADKSVGSDATVITFAPSLDKNETLANTQWKFVQTGDATEGAIAIHKYGAVIYPADSEGCQLEIMVGDTKYVSATASGETYTDAVVAPAEVDVGDEITFVKATLIS